MVICRLGQRANATITVKFEAKSYAQVSLIVIKRLALTALNIRLERDTTKISVKAHLEQYVRQPQHY